MRGAMLLALCTANALQAGVQRPLPASVAVTTSRTPVVFAQENGPFAKLANVPAPALAATFSGVALVVAVRVALLERTLRACLLPRSSHSSAGGTGVFNSRSAGCRPLCCWRYQPAEAGRGLAGRLILLRARRRALHQNTVCLCYNSRTAYYERRCRRLSKSCVYVCHVCEVCVCV